MSHKISIDEKKCIGCGTCVTLCPKIFKIKNKKAEVIKKNVENLDEVLDAESSCPIQAIKISK